MSAEDVLCGECSGRAAVTGGAVVYPDRPDLHHLLFWVCSSCGARVGCHRRTGEPLGSPAGPETRAARQEAHRAFDPFWRGGGMSRSEAYRRLAEALGIPGEECHIGMMDAATARRVVEVCDGWIEIPGRVR